MPETPARAYLLVKQSCSRFVCLIELQEGHLLRLTWLMHLCQPLRGCWQWLALQLVGRNSIHIACLLVGSCSRHCLSSVICWAESCRWCLQCCIVLSTSTSTSRLQSCGQGTHFLAELHSSQQCSVNGTGVCLLLCSKSVWAGPWQRAVSRASAAAAIAQRAATLHHCIVCIYQLLLPLLLVMILPATKRPGLPPNKLLHVLRQLLHGHVAGGQQQYLLLTCQCRHLLLQHRPSRRQAPLLPLLLLPSPPLLRSVTNLTKLLQLPVAAAVCYTRGVIGHGISITITADIPAAICTDIVFTAAFTAAAAAEYASLHSTGGATKGPAAFSELC